MTEKNMTMWLKIKEKRETEQSHIGEKKNQLFRYTI